MSEPKKSPPRKLLDEPSSALQLINGVHDLEGEPPEPLRDDADGAAKEVQCGSEGMRSSTELLRGTDNGMVGSTTEPCLFSERSKDLRTDEEKAELLAWADRFVARNPYIPPPPKDEPIRITGARNEHRGPRDGSIMETTELCLSTERPKDLCTDEEKAAELLAWADRFVAHNPYIPPPPEDESFHPQLYLQQACVRVAFDI